VRGRKMEMKAHIASSEEKAAHWPQLVQMFPKWQMMEDRSSR